MSLIDKMRKAREIGIETAGRKFKIRRPTDEEAVRIGQDNLDMVGIVKRFTAGWDLAELDLIPGGGPEKVPFDADLFGEWVADHPEVWEPLASGIMAAYKEHADRREAAAKN